VIETPPRKGRRIHEALPLEGERERGTMPRGSLSEGASTTLKGTTPGDHEVPWDPGGGENVEHKVDVLARERRGGHRRAVWCLHGWSCGVALWCSGWVGPRGSVRQHHTHEQARTFAYTVLHLPICVEKSTFALGPIEKGSTVRIRKTNKQPEQIWHMAWFLP